MNNIRFIINKLYEIAEDTYDNDGIETEALEIYHWSIDKCIKAIQYDLNSMRSSKEHFEKTGYGMTPKEGIIEILEQQIQRLEYLKHESSPTVLMDNKK